MKVYLCIKEYVYYDDSSKEIIQVVRKEKVAKEWAKECNAQEVKEKAKRVWGGIYDYYYEAHELV